MKNEEEKVTRAMAEKRWKDYSDTNKRFQETYGLSSDNDYSISGTCSVQGYSGEFFLSNDGFYFAQRLTIPIHDIKWLVFIPEKGTSITLHSDQQHIIENVICEFDFFNHLLEIKINSL